MGLEIADLISPAAASLYYFLIYNEIVGSKQKGFVIIEGSVEASKETIAGTRCSLYPEAEEGNCCLSKKIRIGDSLCKAVSHNTDRQGYRDKQP